MKTKKQEIMKSKLVLYFSRVYDGFTIQTSLINISEDLTEQHNLVENIGFRFQTLEDSAKFVASIFHDNYDPSIHNWIHFSPINHTAVSKTQLLMFIKKKLVSTSLTTENRFDEISDWISHNHRVNMFLSGVIGKYNGSPRPSIAISTVFKRKRNSDNKPRKKQKLCIVEDFIDVQDLIAEEEDIVMNECV